MFLPDYVIKALDILKQNGCEGYAVGGCVRDSVLGHTPEDYDIAVSCPPEETEEYFKDYRVIETGIRHGTVTVVVDGYNLELTSFRVDGEYRDMRRPEGVKFTSSLKEDLSRRDFTVNAMAFSPDTGLIDLFDGQTDLKNKVIRCVGEPDRRFNEDALRILRALRFSSVLGFSVEENTAASVIKNRDNLKKISVERIFSELKKLLEGKNSFKILTEFKSVFVSCIPELQDISDEEYGRFAEKAAGLQNALLSFSALLFPLGADAADGIFRRFKSDNAFRNSAVFLITNAEKIFLTVGEAIRFIGANSRESCERLLLFRETLGFDSTLLQNALKKENAPSRISDLKINGSDIIKLGFEGKETGEILNSLLVAVSEGEIENEKTALIDYATTTKFY